MSELITAILAFDIIIDPKQYAYEYRHDGDTYIGCSLLGKHIDCKEYEMYKVDCINCECNKIRKGRRAYEDHSYTGSN